MDISNSSWYCDNYCTQTSYKEHIEGLRKYWSGVLAEAQKVIRIIYSMLPARILAEHKRAHKPEFVFIHRFYASKYT